MLMTLAPTWHSGITEVFPPPPIQIENWLTKPFILSKALKLITPSLTVKVIKQSFDLPYPDEAHCLQINLSEDKNPLVRRVYLQDQIRPYCFARVIIPYATYLQEFQEVDVLGNQFIGEKMLYGREDMTRTPFEFTAINPHQTLFQEAMSGIGDNHACKTLWARRSVFTLGKHPLLITEIFLPPIFNYPNNHG